eukprot:m.63056 g.63056  ORF g.63056 m.63056 type:complete len:57 (+) comp19421_c0_seq3:123-293(+)
MASQPSKKPRVSNKKTRILLVRHGATTLTAEDRFAGATDVLLSETGEVRNKITNNQ